MGATPTVYDVAAHAGVSIATVSRALRRPDDVRESTRQRVRASIRELGYVPSASARGLAARQTGVIGLLLPGYDAPEQPVSPATDELVRVVHDPAATEPVRRPDPYFDEVLRGAELEAWQRGMALMIGVARPAETNDVVTELAGRIDGLLVLAQSLTEQATDQVAHRIPTVLLASGGDRTSTTRAAPASAGAARYDRVGVANTAGMAALTRHLIHDCGVDEFGYVDGTPTSPDGLERRAGFQQALRASGLDPDVQPIYHGAFRRAGGRDVGGNLLADGPLPRALICANDQMALGVLDVLTETGVTVPGDVIVTGFDGIEATQTSAPRLTTVSQPMIELGRMAVATMADRLQDPHRTPVVRQLPVTVLLRESSEG